MRLHQDVMSYPCIQVAELPGLKPERELGLASCEPPGRRPGAMAHKLESADGRQQSAEVVDLPVQLSSDAAHMQALDRSLSPRKAKSPRQAVQVNESMQEAHPSAEVLAAPGNGKSHKPPALTHKSQHHQRHDSSQEVPHPTTIVSRLATLHSRWNWLNWACAILASRHSVSADIKLLLLQSNAISACV